MISKIKLQLNIANARRRGYALFPQLENRNSKNELIAIIDKSAHALDGQSKDHRRQQSAAVMDESAEEDFYITGGGGKFDLSARSRNARQGIMS